jgi:methylated-DNA-[protein]-cysteine S-methyltransferase
MTATRPERLLLDRLPTPIGEALIVTDERGVLRAFNWTEYEGAMRHGLRAHYGPAPIEGTSASPHVRGAFEAYFGGSLQALEGVEWETGGTPFQRLVWRALCKIPAGETRSYGRLAEMVGRPRAVRAVGRANGMNPVAIMAPCHRVIGSDLSLTGYGGGLDRKRWLLRHEGAAFRENRA